MNTTGIFILFFGLYFLFIWKSGKVYPLLYLFLFVYFVQYIFSVYLIYNEYKVLGREMTISQDELFEYIVPALLFLFSGVFLFNRDVNISAYLKKIDPKVASRTGNLLVIFSVFFEIARFVGVPGIDSILSVTHSLMFAGAMCYLFSPSLLNFTIMGLVYIELVREALNAGIFIEFLIWVTYLLLLVSLRYQFSFKVRSSFILLATPLVIMIQSVKSEYRKAAWYGNRESGIELFSELAQKKQEKEGIPFESSDGVINTIGRLNQGWHLGMVLKRVPAKEPFSYGEDLLTDLGGVLLPRVFFPDKKIIGSQDKFKKFTGHKLRGGTSMTIGILGDLYANFGRIGSFIGLFILGALVAKIYNGFLLKYVLTNPINIVWVPFLFSYLVRANNDFYIVANHLFKGFLIFLLINFIYKQLWPQRPSLGVK